MARHRTLASHVAAAFISLLSTTPKYNYAVGPPDTGLFRAINHWPQALGPTMKFLSEATNYTDVKVLLGILVLGMLIRNSKTRTTVLLALVAVGAANSFTEVFKHTWPMHRPFQDFPNDVIMWVGKTENFGTASAHSANMAAVAYVFVRYLKAWGAPWVAIAVLVGISRIFCGAHYPYQVALGWACGVLAAFIVTAGWEQWKARRSLSEDVPTEPEVSVS